MSSRLSSDRAQVLAANALVVKVGSSTLTQGTHALDLAFVDDLARQIAHLHREGRHVVLVSSGAIRVGLGALGLTAARTMPEKQAAAAVGQGLLMHSYQEVFARHGLRVAQVLLTRNDLADRHRFLNARNTFRTLLAFGVVPIVNENDTVAVDEIQFGDNDTLAALVAIAAECEAVALLSDVPGFSPDGKRGGVLPEVHTLTAELLAAASGADGRGGTGGMLTKLEAAKVAMRSGIPLVLAHGREPEVVLRLARGEALGTLFVPRSGLNARKRWIAFAGRPRGVVVVNEGAKQSLLAHGKSLLPVGVVAVRGNFEQGDLIALEDEHGHAFARGLVNYNATDAARIAGLRTHRIARALGKKDFDELVHRDNLVVT